MRKYMKQLGQGMTEYIIIVALIAIAAIGIYTLFGDVIRDQMGAMTQELAGGQGDNTAAVTIGGDTGEAATAKTLATFEESN